MKNQLSHAVAQFSANPKSVKITLAVLTLVGVVIPGVLALAGPINGGV
jgi:hypothetical protein